MDSAEFSFTTYLPSPFRKQGATALFVFPAPAGLQTLVSATQRLSVAPSLVPDSAGGSAVAPAGGLAVSSVPGPPRRPVPALALGSAVGAGCRSSRRSAPGSVPCPGPVSLPLSPHLSPGALRPAARHAASRRPVTSRSLTPDYVPTDANDDDRDAVGEMDEDDLATLDDYDMVSSGQDGGFTGNNGSNGDHDVDNQPLLEAPFGARRDAGTHTTSRVLRR